MAPMKYAKLSLAWISPQYHQSELRGRWGKLLVKSKKKNRVQGSGWKEESYWLSVIRY